jgi:hypothetical protein
MKTTLLALGILWSTIAYSQIPTGNLLGEYKFTNGTLNTSVGNQHFIQTGSAMTLVPNRAGGVNEAINLNGDHLQRAPTSGHSLSVSFWIKTSTNDINKRVIMDQSERATEAEGAAETGWYAYLKDGKIGVAGNFQWYHNNSSVNGATGYIAWHQVVSPTLISDGNWHHVTVTIEAYAGNWYNAPYQRTDRVIRNTYKIYIDNVASITQENVKNVGNATNPQMRRFVTATTPVTLANSKNANSTNRYQEIIDDIRYYNVTLTAPQVATLAAEVACAGSTSVTAVAKNITAVLDATGNATIQASDVDDGSVNSCGDPATTLSLDVTEFTCDDLGENTVTLTAEDALGNTDTTTATVTVTQLISVVTIGNVLVVPLDASGNATISPADINNGSTSSCGTGGLTMTLSKTTFSCIDSGVTHSVTLTVSDAHGNSATGNAFVRAEDTTVPTVVTKNISVQLDMATGLATITPQMLDDGTTDNCSFTLSVSKTTFTCNDIGENTVTFSATDGASAVNVGAIVTVTSAIANETVTTANADLCTDGTQSATISTGSSLVGVNYVLRNSEDNSIVDGPIPGTGSAIDFTTGLLNEKTTFNVFADMGGEQLSNALDFDGANDKVITSYIFPATNALTMEAWIFPRSTNHDRLISNFDGAGSFQPGEFVFDMYHGTDNGRGLRFIVAGAGGVLGSAGVADVLTLNEWNHVAVTFNSGTIGLFVNGIQVATSTASFTSIPASAFEVHIGEDRIQGTALEYFNGKVDEVRLWTVARTAEELLTNKNKCLTGGESGLGLYYNFDESNGATVPDLSVGFPGTLTNMDTGTDWVSGVSIACGSSCNLQMSTEITIGDATPPTVVAKAITVLLDAAGVAAISAVDVDNGSSDNCPAGEGLLFSLDKTSFTCDDLGTTTVTLTAVDASGNEATATATVTVQETIAPIVVTKNITINLDANNSATITAAELENGTTDNCTPSGNLTFTVDVASFTDANVGDNTVTLSAEDAHGNIGTATAIVTVVSKDPQTIEFATIADKTYGDGSFNLAATATSGLSVTYALLNGPVTLTGNTVTITGAGTVTIEATQAGDDDYLTAEPVQQTFTIVPAPLTVTAASQTITYGDAIPALTYSYTGFVNEESTSALTEEPTISTTATVISDAADYAITLTGGSADNYAFTLVNGVLTISKADLTVNVEPIAEKDINDEPFNVIATITGEHVLSYAITGPATISGTLVTLNGTEGTVTVTASHAGSVNFNPASASVTFEVIDHRQAQAITFSVIPDQSIESGQTTLSATASSGLPVTFELVSGPATISGNTVSFDELGTVVLRAIQAGNTSFHAATPVERSFEIFTITAVREIASGLKIYPNPATDYLQIEIPDGEEAEVFMSSMDGRDAISTKTSTGRVDISTLSGGLYVLRVHVAGKVAAIHKIVKN